MSFVYEFGYALLAWTILAVPGGAVAAVLWLISGRAALVPTLRHRAVPWRETEVVVALLTMLVIPPAVYFNLPRTGFLDWLYGPGFPAFAPSVDADPNLRLATARHLLWSTALAAPLQVLTILIFAWITSGTRPSSLGLHFRHGRLNLTIGFLGWLIATPLILAVNLAVEVCFTWWHGKPPVPHDLTQAIQHHSTGADWALVVFAAVVAAPLYEELLFRGILQGWMIRKPWGGEAVIVGALLLAMLSWPGHGPAPAIFVLLLVPGFYYSEVLFWRWLPKLNLVRTIYGVALLFAAAHSNVWPTPIPLFLLGLALGWLAFRTQSLIAPIAFHALFNGVACLQLAFLANR